MFKKLITCSVVRLTRSNRWVSRSLIHASRSKNLTTCSAVRWTRSNNPFERMSEPFATRLEAMTVFYPFNRKPLVYVFPWEVTFISSHLLYFWKKTGGQKPGRIGDGVCEVGKERTEVRVLKGWEVGEIWRKYATWCLIEIGLKGGNQEKGPGAGNESYRRWRVWICPHPPPPHPLDC